MGATDQPTELSAGRRRRRHAEARRHERGLSGNRLGHGGAAPRADQAAGGGRLEHVLHRLLRARLLHPGEPSAAARQRQGRLVRLARRSEDRGAAGGVVQRTGPRRRRRRSATRCSFRRSRTCRTTRSGWRSPTAFRPDITGVPEGFPIFWNVRRTAGEWPGRAQPRTANAVIVIFGAAVRPGGRPSTTLRRRVEAAAAFGSRLAAPLFLPTGGGPLTARPRRP